MRQIEPLKLLDLGNDVLEVHGTIDGRAATARGWVSATTNHYNADDYEEIAEPAKGKQHKGEVAGRHLKASAKPRVMTKAERLSYAIRLLDEQNQQPKEIAL